ncbi:uncharacterized protein F54H12.2-like [Lytechinus pictus]|uniref:uncharacterized protein F54H12.2-like n=1 Tax=Lytechinus pictus TaxID=7653 RepID=UPI0030BA0B38
MALVHEKSCPCTTSALDLFTVPPTQLAVEDGYAVDYHPIANIDSGPIEFFVSGSGTEYVDLAKTYLQVKARVVKANGANLEPTDKVGPVNLFMQSLFSQVDVSLNEKIVTPSMPTYPYRAYADVMLNYGPAALKSLYTMSLFQRDTPGKMDVAEPSPEDGDADENEGLSARYRYAKNSALIEMISPIHADLFFQPRYLINGVDLRVKLIRHKDAFSLMTNTPASGYRVKIESCTLYVRKIKVSPSTALTLERALEKTTAKYPIDRVVTKVISVSTGQMSLQQDHVFLGQLPKKVVVAMVDNRAFNGNYEKNPFNFQHFKTNYLALDVDGKLVPSKPFQPDFEGGTGKEYLREYYTLFSELNKLEMQPELYISRDDYGRGFTMFAFDLTPTGNSEGSFNLRKNGNLRLDIHFKEPLPRTINIIVIGTFENVVEIDRARNILYDFSV